jgi:glycerophosphoryl diester phosphodiesterase
MRCARYGASMPRSSSSDVLLGFAHRGGMADAPENSLEAFQKALAAGANGLESDVWLNAAGEPVLHHGKPERLRDNPLSLASLFVECGTDFDLSLDLKGTGTAEATVQACRVAGFDVRRLWLCAGLGTCARLRQWDAEVRLVCDMGWTDALWRRKRAFARVADAGVDAVNLRHGRWTRSFVAQAHEAGLLAFAWDINRRFTLRLALRRGVDGVYSDHVRLLHDARELSARRVSG